MIFGDIISLVLAIIYYIVEYKLIYVDLFFFQQIEEDDEMPKQICINCLNKLDTTYELYTTCKVAQNDIRKKLNSVQKLPSCGSNSVEVNTENGVEN